MVNGDWLGVSRFVGALMLALAATQCPGEETAAKQIGRLDHEPICESSGLAKSRLHKGVWWTLNDSGNAAVVYAVSREGKLIREVRLHDKVNLDWESLAIGEDGTLWVGDIGDNLRRRQPLFVHKFAEPDPRKADAVTATTYALAYPDGPHDAEGLFVAGGKLYLVTKEAPPAATGVYVADGLTTNETVTMKRVASLTLNHPVTGADLSLAGKRLVLTGCDWLHVFIGQGEVTDLLRARPHRLEIPGTKQVEAVAFEGHDLILTNEQRQIFRVKAETYERAPQVDVSPSTP